MNVQTDGRVSYTYTVWFTTHMCNAGKFSFSYNDPADIGPVISRQATATLFATWHQIKKN